MKKNVLIDFWVRKNINNKGKLEWLPLKVHLNDINFIAKHVYDNYLSQSIKQKLEQKFKQPKNLITCLAMISKIGYVSPTQQMKRCYSTKHYQLAKKLNLKLDKLLYQKQLLPADFNEYPLYQSNVSPLRLVSLSLLNHYHMHTDLLSLLNLSKYDMYQIKFNLKNNPMNYYFIDNDKDKIHQRWQKQQEYYLNYILNANGYRQVVDLPHITNEYQMIFKSLLIMINILSQDKIAFSNLPINQTQSQNISERLNMGWEISYHNYLKLTER